ncbi:hypothetical protein D8674_037899 [Pyrus ussuriensis x Pyrus communis]|uniref:Uncharacterized protein n=1 Tax=Pyrus ussuriensis x Pyrus communis TaxID=2448454 RepID=A0A5N5H3V5_9ROSA|nr:hypothetical protein D8674_037899 [Pyrus ussuriensis x Pyrus communis]
MSNTRKCFDALDCRGGGPSNSLAAETIVSNTSIIYFFLFVDITMADEQHENGLSSGFRGDSLSKVSGAEQNGGARGVGGGVPEIFSQQKLCNHQRDEKVHNLTNRSEH